MIHNLCQVSPVRNNLSETLLKTWFIFTSQNRSDEEENKEPPKKKEKLMELQKKASKLSLKQKNSKPLSRETNSNIS